MAFVYVCLLLCVVMAIPAQASQKLIVLPEEEWRLWLEQSAQEITPPEWSRIDLTPRIDVAHRTRPDWPSDKSVSVPLMPEGIVGVAGLGLSPDLWRGAEADELIEQMAAIVSSFDPDKWRMGAGERLIWRELLMLPMDRVDIAQRGMHGWNEQLELASLRIQLQLRLGFFQDALTLTEHMIEMLQSRQRQALQETDDDTITELYHPVPLWLVQAQATAKAALGQWGAFCLGLRHWYFPAKDDGVSDLHRIGELVCDNKEIQAISSAEARDWYARAKANPLVAVYPLAALQHNPRRYNGWLRAPKASWAAMVAGQENIALVYRVRAMEAAFQAGTMDLTIAQDILALVEGRPNFTVEADKAPVTALYLVFEDQETKPRMFHTLRKAITDIGLGTLPRGSMLLWEGKSSKLSYSVNQAPDYAPIGWMLARWAGHGEDEARYLAYIDPENPERVLHDVLWGRLDKEDMPSWQGLADKLIPHMEAKETEVPTEQDAPDAKEVMPVLLSSDQRMKLRGRSLYGLIEGYNLRIPRSVENRFYPFLQETKNAVEVIRENINDRTDSRKHFTQNGQYLLSTLSLLAQTDILHNIGARDNITKVQVLLDKKSSSVFSKIMLEIYMLFVL